MAPFCSWRSHSWQTDGTCWAVCWTRCQVRLFEVLPLDQHGLQLAWGAPLREVVGDTWLLRVWLLRCAGGWHHGLVGCKSTLLGVSLCCIGPTFCPFRSALQGPCAPGDNGARGEHQGYEMWNSRPVAEKKYADLHGWTSSKRSDPAGDITFTFYIILRF